MILPKIQLFQVCLQLCERSSGVQISTFTIGDQGHQYIWSHGVWQLPEPILWHSRNSISKVRRHLSGCGHKGLNNFCKHSEHLSVQTFICLKDHFNSLNYHTRVLISLAFICALTGYWRSRMDHLKHQPDPKCWRGQWRTVLLAEILFLE